MKIIIINSEFLMKFLILIENCWKLFFLMYYVLNVFYIVFRIYIVCEVIWEIY